MEHQKREIMSLSLGFPRNLALRRLNNTTYLRASFYFIPSKEPDHGHLVITRLSAKTILTYQCNWSPS